MSTKNFLQNPNLPRGKVTDILCSHHLKGREGIPHIIPTPKVNIAYPEISHHPDLMLHHLGGRFFVSAPETADYFQKVLPEAKIFCGKSPVGRHYPEDIAYNVARVNRYAFHHAKYTDFVICEYFEQNGVTLIDVPQGYTKCSVAVISENAIITSDSKIAYKADLNGIDVLKIREGGIRLSGFPYGFVGGCCGLISREMLLVNGNLSQHPDFLEMQNFCRKYNVSFCFLHDGFPVDVGSIIPVYEYI